MALDASKNSMVLSFRPEDHTSSDTKFLFLIARLWNGSSLIAGTLWLQRQVVFVSAAQGKFRTVSCSRNGGCMQFHHVMREAPWFLLGSIRPLSRCFFEPFYPDKEERKLLHIIWTESSHFHKKREKERIEIRKEKKV